MSDRPGRLGVRADLAMPTPAEIKKALLAAGLEVYQTRGDVVHVAERVRENLIMDSGVRVYASEVRVAFVTRSHKNDFPNEPEERLFERARALAAPAVERGYREVDAMVTRVMDPGDSGRTLDTLCEVVFERSAEDLARAMDEVRFALSVEKSAAPR